MALQLNIILISIKSSKAKFFLTNSNNILWNVMHYVWRYVNKVIIKGLQSYVHGLQVKPRNHLKRLTFTFLWLVITNVKCLCLENKHRCCKAQVLYTITYNLSKWSRTVMCVLMSVVLYGGFKKTGLKNHPNHTTLLGMTNKEFLRVALNGNLKGYMD